MATNKPVLIDELFGELKVYGEDLMWTVVHTKPRCEKKLATYARQNGIPYYLPQYTASRIYQRRKVTFATVMFPGYLFVVIDHNSRQTLSISGFAVGYIKVKAQQRLVNELKNLHGTFVKEVKVKPGLWLSKGLEVLITDGPLKGMQGVVESHTKLSEVRLQVSILRQAVLVSVDPATVKILGEYEIVEQDE
ncbi:MAG: hypothetical protein KA984_05445 [Candidatus Cloacimonetes bacterium]|nr:hypothetical protein [Candidatus Cloacimonadota bacterium]